MLRTIFEDQKRSAAKEEQVFSRDLNELTQFVRAGRLHNVSPMHYFFGHWALGTYSLDHLLWSIFLTCMT
jgi:hypothetical protein